MYLINGIMTYILWFYNKHTQEKISFWQKRCSHLIPYLGYCRVAYTKIKTETRRWARIPLESRLCGCGDIQPEEHILLRFPLTLYICSTFKIPKYSRVCQLLNVNNPNILDVCQFCAECLSFLVKWLLLLGRKQV